ncbi:MAG TPA: type II toxin-antitoxin system RelE/ParE family toxin [Candidatus Paceibacterota bacterium]|nr:type II toxin-antitoxin system RelE/ParE family toxin [Candidatus Paceibacterota bacterium]
MDAAEPILTVPFFRTETGREPVREWLKSLPRENRRIIGEDIKTVQFGWPLGMPLVRKLDKGLWEIRVRLPDSIARIVFTTGERRMILLHGFIKKSQKTPREDLELAKTRLRVLL